MLAKLTAKNQITLPKELVRQLEPTDYFDVQLENGRLILTPVVPQMAGVVRDKLEALGITEDDIDAAVAWASKKS
ncbi:MAG TPA: AbrB/MazE/SpoVT family DNA-binding domain-containing protein [Thermoanaerobaculia bacterium]|nr:AbrB/MazE/SpoVT family DNA-binding domain-containing protein [Thermoanaerobaculia bacterium]